MDNGKLRERIRQLESERELLLGIIGRLPGHVYWLSRDGAYLGCNDQQALDFGLSSRNEVVGKTNYDLFPRFDAEHVVKVNENVMSSNQQYEGEEIVSTGGESRCFLSRKVPLVDASGNVFGLLGISMDVTERKLAEELAFENCVQESQLKTSNDFCEFIHQAAHDLASPLCVLESTLSLCHELSQKHVETLKSVVSDIRSIANMLSTRFRSEEDRSYEMKEQSLLVHLMLQEVISNKRSEYKNDAVDFSYHCQKGLEFSTIMCDPLNFRRAVSNVINNAVDALKYRTGSIKVRLSGNDKDLHISIEDSGVGMPVEMANRVRSQMKIISTKQNGNGLGLAQLYYTIKKYRGRLGLISEEDKGTKFTLTFGRAPIPKYIADGFTLKKGTTLLILDDVVSMFDEWRNILKKFGDDINVKYFVEGNDALEFIEEFDEKDKLFFLSDFYLRSQPKNGLTIILESGIKRQSMLVTSFYSNKKIFDCAEESGIRVLPKQLINIADIKVV